MLYEPATGTVTFTLIVQLLFGASVPFEKEMEAAPATGAKVGVPQPVVVAPGVGATVIAPGVVSSVSVKFKPLTVTEVGLVNVKVNAETPPALVGSGLKFFAMVTAEAGSTIYAKRVEIP